MVRSQPAKARDVGSVPGSGRSPGGGNGTPPVFFPGRSNRQRSLVGYSPRGVRELDATEHMYAACVCLYVYISVSVSECVLCVSECMCL